MFPSMHMLRASCPAAPDGLLDGGGCCLAAGSWALGRRNGLVRRSLWQLCSYHDVHMFPFQLWRAEVAEETPSAAVEEATSAEEAAQAEAAATDATAAFLERSVTTRGVESLQRLLPNEVLGVGEYASVDEIRTAFRRLSRRFHPDKNHEVHSRHIFDAIRAASEALKDENWRSAAQEDAVSRFFSLDGLISEVRALRPHAQPSAYSFGDPYTRMRPSLATARSASTLHMIAHSST